MKRLALVLILLIASSNASAWSYRNEEGIGLAYGKDHAYFLTAPPGWVLDTDCGASQNLYAVFYPKGSSWDAGEAVVYSNAAGRDGLSREDAIKRDVKEFTQKNPQIVVVDGTDIETEDHKKASVRYFTGDKFGNYEAVAYVPEDAVIANIVLTARNKSAYESALPAFKKIVQSYRFLTNTPDKLNLFDALKLEYKRVGKPLPGPPKDSPPGNGMVKDPADHDRSANDRH